MRVVHVTPYFAPAFVYGGPPRAILSLCQGLQGAGVDVEVVTTVANGASDLPPSLAGSSERSGWPADEYGGVPVHYAARAFPPAFFNSAIREPIRVALKRSDVCHIHGLWTIPAWQAARAARQLGVPFVVSPRGILQPAARSRRGWRKRVAFQLFERHYLKDAERVHATSEAEAVVLRTIVEPSRVVTIPNGVDLSASDRVTSGARARFGIPENVPLVVFVGRLHPIKRLDLLTEAVALVRDAYPSTRLVLAGPEEGGLAPIAWQLARLGQSVQVVGSLDDEAKWALLRESTALVMCSDSENFGASVAEAMAAACPVVVTQTCPWREVQEQGCGYWVAQNARSIADALSSIIADPRLAASMGAQGSRLARTRYGWRGIGAAMAACYADILSSGRQVA
jgi:glycosyltransferase involved in cell wall biosynthesis